MKTQLVALLLLISFTAKAQVVTISMSGTITGVVHDGGTDPTQISAGNPWSLSFSYDVGAGQAVDLSADSKFGQYRPTNSPNSFNFSIGTPGPSALVPGDTTYLLEIVDNGATDQITFKTDHSWSHVDPTDGTVTYNHDAGHAPFVFLQSDQNPLSSDSLPTGSLNLSDWNLNKTLTFGSFYDPPGVLVNASHQISGTIDSLSLVTVVPEPGHYALVIGAASLVFAVSRKRRLVA